MKEVKKERKKERFFFLILSRPDHSGTTMCDGYHHVTSSHFSDHICPPPRAQVRFQYAFETVSGFILPYAVIIVSYVLILRRLRQTRFRRKVHSEKLILAIVIMFGLFWLPYHVVNMMQVGHLNDILHNVYQVINQI